MTEQHISTHTYTEALLNTFPTAKLEQAKSLAQQFKLDNYENIRHFGLPIQEKSAQLSHQMLLFTQRKDLSKISDILNQLVAKLIDVNPELLVTQKQSFFQKLFGKSPSTIPQIMTNFQRLFVQIDRLGIQLQYAQQQLLDDVKGLQQLATMNADYLDNLEIHIAAIEILKQQALPLTEQSKKNELSDIANMNHMEPFITLLDQRHYDLQLSRQVFMQTAAQLQIIMHTHEQLAKKIQTSILSTIPLWKNQMSMLFTLNKQLTASKLEQQLLAASKDFANNSVLSAQQTAQAIQQQGQQANFNLEAFKELQASLLDMIADTIHTQQHHLQSQQQLAEQLDHK